MAVLFDTLKLADRLEAAAMPARQAHEMAAALADTLTGTVATKADVEASELRLRTEIAEMRAEVRGWLITQAFDHRSECRHHRHPRGAGPAAALRRR